MKLLRYEKTTEIMKKIPVLVLAFNRADHVEKSMQAIAQYKPDKLYLECDGARPHKAGEKEAVEQTRKTMLDIVDWPCEVKTLFRDKNLGCANAVNDAITWFFKNEEYGCIIEDDIVVSQDFFRLCEDLLIRYRFEPKVMQISARNTSSRTDMDNTYVYAECFHCWGWATWRRAWEKMDMSMSAVERISLCYLMRHLGWFRGGMMYILFKKGKKHISTFSSWATRWYLSILDNKGLVICPGVNLALNIGMDGGTHFDEYDKSRPSSRLTLGKVAWPLSYNESFVPDKKQKKFDSDFYFENRVFGLRKKIRKLLKL